MWPHRRQPTRLLRPWDSPGKNTGVGCHFLLQCMKVKSESEVAQLCPTLSDPMDCSLTGSSLHGIFQARVLEWGAIQAKSMKHITPILNPKVNNRLWVIVSWQCRSNNCDKCTTVIWGVHSGGSCVCVGNTQKLYFLVSFADKWKCLKNKAYWFFFLNQVVIQVTVNILKLRERVACKTSQKYFFPYLNFQPLSP